MYFSTTFADNHWTGLTEGEMFLKVPICFALMLEMKMVNSEPLAFLKPL